MDLRCRGTTLAVEDVHDLALASAELRRILFHHASSVARAARQRGVMLEN
jgi:hypothetical protein